MKHFAITIIVAFITCSAVAQTQQGFVRTAGTAKKKGLPISSVTIRPSGSAPVLSDSKGLFTLALNNVRAEGDAFSIASVRKNGFELLDKDALKHKFTYSKNVPIEIVLISTDELIKTRQEIEERARKNAVSNYNKKIADLKAKLQMQQITSEEYSKKIKEMETQMESFESLVTVMADHYARTDYDKLDSLNAAINECIANGELTKADSLINTKGDVRQRAFDNIQKGQAIRAAEAQLDSVRSVINSNKEALEQEKRRIDLWKKQNETIGNQ